MVLVAWAIKNNNLVVLIKAEKNDVYDQNFSLTRQICNYSRKL